MTQIVLAAVEVLRSDLDLERKKKRIFKPMRMLQ